MKEIKIKKSNFKIIFLSVIGILFGFLCLNMFNNPHRYLSFVFRSELFIKVFGIIAFALTFIAIFLIVIKYFKNSFGLIINESGIIDNSSVASVGLIEWKDIKGIRENNIMSTHFLLIDVSNAEKYIKKSNNVLLSMLLKSNVKTNGTPIAISNKALNCDFSELRSIVYEQYHYYTKSS